MGNSCDGVLFAPKKGQWQISVLLGGGNNFYNENTSYLLPKFSHNGKPGNGDNGTVGLPNDDKDNAQNGDLSAYLNIDGLNNNSLTNILGIEGKYFLSDCWDINFQFSMNINLTPKKDYVEGDYEVEDMIIPCTGLYQCPHEQQLVCGRRIQPLFQSGQSSHPSLSGRLSWASRYN